MSQYHSTSNDHIFVSLKEALFQGLAPDRGLYMSKTISPMSGSFFESIQEKSFKEIAFEVARHIMKGEIPDEDLKTIVEESFPFDSPLRHIHNTIYALELFHGPTLSFKDFGARFMARLFGYFLQENEKPLTVLVATSGDTGSAVAHGFYTVPGINVCVLYPSGKVSDIQEKQMTTLNENITAIEIEGTFDDCQRLVKEAFSDEKLRGSINITSANSINIGRLIPQTFYYFYAYAQLPVDAKNIAISVPSGNFGNLTAGLIAKRMGLPITRFIASTNINDIIPKYLESGVFTPKESLKTLSNAMDVGNPSNFQRIQSLYNKDLDAIRKDILGFSFTDKETLQAIKDVYHNHGYVLDPHGAVAYLGLQKYLSDGNTDYYGIFLETAHPAKFKETVDTCLNKDIAIPERLKECLNKEKKSINIPNEYNALKNLLLTKGNL